MGRYFLVTYRIIVNQRWLGAVEIGVGNEIRTRGFDLGKVEAD
jgi:hypothetical protein